MRLTNRNPLALFYSSFLFGSLAVPYYYLALGFLIHEPITTALQVFLWLAACTTLLLLILIARTRLEQMLAKILGRFFRPFLIVAVTIAAALSWQIELGIASFPLMLPVEYWSSLIEASAIATAIAFVVVISTPPSRLERFLSARFTCENKWCVAIGCLLLVLGFIFVGWEFYQLYFLPLPNFH
jgi:hypothetical protein